MSFEEDEEKVFFKMMRDYCDNPENKEKLIEFLNDLSIKNNQKKLIK